MLPRESGLYCNTDIGFLHTEVGRRWRHLRRRLRREGEQCEQGKQEGARRPAGVSG